MAAIDKLYGTEEQYFEFLNWCFENNQESLDYFYSWDYHNNEITHAMTCFPMYIDKWMLQNCPFDFVTSQIKNQYNISDNEYDLFEVFNEEDD